MLCTILPEGNALRVLIIGNGGREHAIGWKLRQSPQLKELFFTPQNAGLAKIAETADVSAGDFVSIKEFCKKNSVDLVAIGPEAPLVGGLSDFLQEEGITVFGPRKRDAELEGSKTFAKKLMQQSSLPTAEFESFNNKEEALAYVQKKPFPQVIKADGLAAGKGVVIVENLKAAENLLVEIFQENKFGSAGNTVVVEEFLQGQEVSLLAFTDGVTVLPMVEAQDYKPINDDDEGPNTGGMGCYSPVPSIAEDTLHKIISTIIEPTVYALSSRGLIYQGVLYTGLILTDEGPKVLEYNARFGDPETQVILPRMDTDLLEVMLATANQELDKVDLEFNEKACLSVVLASGGYPGNYQTGYEITGIEKAEELGATVFHAGTMLKDNKVFTNGGRVLNVTVLAKDFMEARETAYNACSKISFNYKYNRSDIGLRALQHLSYSNS